MSPTTLHHHHPSQARQQVTSISEAQSAQATASSRRYPTAVPMKPRTTRASSNTSTVPDSPTSARPINRSKSITVIEPTREQYLQETSTKKGSATGKVIKGAGDAVGFCLYVLFFCCVLSGEKRPEPKKRGGAYYYNFDDELEGPRVRKVCSIDSGSKASSEKIERV